MAKTPSLPAYRPTHPGAILREDVLAPLFEAGVTLVAIAAHLGVSRQTLYRLLNEERSMTPDMAARLGRAVGNSPMFWLNLQAQYDLWHAMRDRNVKKVRPFSNGGKRCIANATTSKAMAESLRSKGKRFSSIDDLMRDLND